MTKVIKGIGSKSGSGNDAYKVGRGKVVTRPTLVKEVEQGKHPGHHVVKIDGTKYVRANPDNSPGNNVND
ncbi:hypothetical protein WG68_18110 [Arsukibacterium ikkense]|uniref:DUF3892 domain-containing protein n=1 Tax=Arsukibacterium ikkense TaxID=336831 RepID=A0A0M2V011_9GAMM|nr:DUF3892 domain-containing protein [Arsukibacterium ikkense]KKO43926.1 hypothetical protein WG68_18110 [Arsukibacterium ikkense]